MPYFISTEVVDMTNSPRIFPIYIYAYMYIWVKQHLTNIFVLLHITIIQTFIASNAHHILALHPAIYRAKHVYI